MRYSMINGEGAMIKRRRGTNRNILSLSFSHDGLIKLLGVDITDYHSFETHIHNHEIKRENDV